MRSTRFAVAVFPAVIIGALAAGLALDALGVSLAMTCIVVTTGVTVVLVILEWWRPHTTEMRLNSDSQAVHDLSHFLLASRLGSPIGSYVLAVAAARLIGAQWGETLITWPSGWPLALEALIVWLILGFLDYWTHRSYHSIDALWWLHAVHHDSDGLNVLKSGRVHAFEGMVNGTVFVVLVLAGAPLVAITVAVAANAVINNLSHANIEQRLWRPLHWVVPTVDLHRIHHAKDRALHDTNLGLPFFDLAFGTYTSPVSCPTPEMGRTDAQAPESFLGQLWYPIRQWSASVRSHLRPRPPDEPSTTESRWHRLTSTSGTPGRLPQDS